MSHKNIISRYIDKKGIVHIYKGDLNNSENHELRQIILTELKIPHIVYFDPIYYGVINYTDAKT